MRISKRQGGIHFIVLVMCLMLLSCDHGTEMRQPSPQGDAAGRTRHKSLLRHSLVDITDVNRKETSPVVLHRAEPSLSRGSAADLQLKVEVRHQDFRDYSRADIRLEDRSGKDRALAVDISLPMDGKGWTWWEDLRGSRKVRAGETVYTRTSSSNFGSEGKLSIYPLSSLCGEKEGVCLAVPPDAPRDFTIRWDRDKGLTIRFYLGTSPATKRFPNRATASVIVYQIAPEWGFRQALAEYYRFFPDYFERRARKAGAWMCGGLASEYNSPEATAALGERPSDLFGYHLVFSKLQGTAAEDLKYGLVPIPFTIAVAKLRYRGPAITNAREARAALGRMGTQGFDGRFQGYWGGPDTVRNSVLEDSQGLPVIMPYKPEHAQPGTRMCSYLVNVDPDLFEDRSPRPRTAGQQCLKASQNSVRQCPQVGGTYFDYLSSITPYANHRREHFASTDIPLTFLGKTGEVVIHNRFSLIEYLREVRSRFQDPSSPLYGKLLWSNSTKYFGGGVAFMAFLVDIPGFEWPVRWQKFDWVQFDFIRAISFRKPVLHTCNSSEKSIRAVDFNKVIVPWYHRMAFYGIPPVVREVFNYPELLARHRPLIQSCLKPAIQLQTAGWQPVTLARTNRSEVWVERFGPAPDGATFFSMFNSSPETVQVTLKLGAAVCSESVDFSVLGHSELSVLPRRSGGGWRVPFRLAGHRFLALRVSRR